jgi:hypothetical protein
MEVSLFIYANQSPTKNRPSKYLIFEEISYSSHGLSRFYAHKICLLCFSLEFSTLQKILQIMGGGRGGGITSSKQVIFGLLWSLGSVVIW